MKKILILFLLLTSVMMSQAQVKTVWKNGTVRFSDSAEVYTIKPVTSIRMLKEVTFEETVTFNAPGTIFTGDITVANVAATSLTVSSNSTFDDDVQMLTARFRLAYGAAVTSGNSITLGFDGNVFNITGTTEIRNISVSGWSSGSDIYLLFTGACPINQAFGGSGQMIDPGGDFTTVANGLYHFVLVGTDWYRVK